MGRVDDLTVFLTARLDEDEGVAKAVRDRHWMMATIPGGELAPGVPGRVLREIEADRRLLAEWQKAEADPAVDDQWNAGLAAGLRLAVQIRTARYGDHPDYRQEWKP
jgi:hypothetical protein